MHVLRNEALSLLLNLPVLVRLLLQLLLNQHQALLKNSVIILRGALQRLLHDALDHLLVALDFELSVGDSGHVVHELLLSLHHERLALLWVHSPHLEVILLVLLHAALERGKIVVDHKAIDRELLLGLKLENARDGKVQRHAAHQSLDHVQQDLRQVHLVDQNALLLRSVDVGCVLTDAQSLQLFGIPQICHVLLQRRRELI